MSTENSTEKKIAEIQKPGDFGTREQNIDDAPRSHSIKSDAERKKELENLVDEYLDSAGINLCGGIASVIGHRTIVGEKTLNKSRNVESLLSEELFKNARKNSKPPRNEYDLIRKEGIHETMTVIPLEKTEIINTGRVETKKGMAVSGKNIFGKPKYKEVTITKPVMKEVCGTISHSELVSEGSDEPATSIFLRVMGLNEYVDNSGRGGQQILVELILPASKAMVLVQEVKNNPEIFKEIIRKAVVERSQIGEEGWSGVTEDNRGHKLEPPYDKWKNKEGKEILRIFDLSNGEDYQEVYKDLEF